MHDRSGYRESAREDILTSDMMRMCSQSLMGKKSYPVHPSQQLYDLVRCAGLALRTPSRNSVYRRDLDQAFHLYRGRDRMQSKRSALQVHDVSAIAWL